MMSVLTYCFLSFPGPQLGPVAAPVSSYIYYIVAVVVIVVVCAVALVVVLGCIAYVRYVWIS